MRDVIAVALGQALRLGEVAGLDWKDIDFDAGTLMPGLISVRVGPEDDIVALVLCKGRSLPPAHRTH
jgi:integrase